MDKSNKNHDENLIELASSRKERTKLLSVKIIKDDLKVLFGQRKKRLTVIVIALIPLLYSFLYLDAFWDPYSKLDKMPVAVVNLDKGSVKDNEAVYYGNKIIDKLKDNKKVKWEFVDYEKAKEGVKGKTYYSMVVIPVEFSAKITQAAGGKFDKASILYISNEKKNFLAGQVSSRIMLELKDEIAKSITEEGSKVVIDKLYDAKDGILKAYNGSKELKDGVNKLYDGSVTLNSKLGDLKAGISDLNTGAAKLSEGLNSAYTGSNRFLNEGLIKFDTETKSGKSKLLSGAQELSTHLTELNKGLNGYNTQVTDGENKLKDGGQKLSDGLKTLQTGLNDYNTQITEGENKLYDGSQSLVEGLKKLSGGIKDYNSQISGGENQLRSGADNLSSGIGKFSMGLSDYDTKVSAGEGQIGTGLGKLKGGLQQLNTSLSSEASKQQLDSLVKGTEGLATGLAGAAKGVNTAREDMESLMSDNSIPSDVKQKLSSVYQVLVKLDSKEMPILQGTANQISTGTGLLASKQKELADAVDTLNKGADDLSTGYTAFQMQGSQGRQQLLQGVKDISAGASQLSSGVIDFQMKGSQARQLLIKGAGDAVNGAADLRTGINNFKTKASQARQQLMDGAEEAYTGSSQITAGISDLQSKGSAARKLLLGGSGQLTDGSNQLLSGLKEYDTKSTDGMKELIAGATELNKGIYQLNDGAKQLGDGQLKALDGAARLYSGSGELTEGLNELNNGAKELNEKLNDGYKEMNEKLTFKSEDMSSYLAQPLALDEQPINHVPDYGSGFAPYFIPLSLWVGALLMFLVVPIGVNKKYKNSPRSVVFGKLFTLGIIGVFQAVISSFVILIALHLDVKSVSIFFGFNILMSIAFIAVIQSLVYIFGEDVGRFLALVLLMLQLTSCGGTFPMELVPNFFKVISPWLPMTYATSALREIISGIDYGVLNHDILVLTLFTVAFVAVSIRLKSRVEKIKTRIITLRNAQEEIA